MASSTFYLKYRPQKLAQLDIKEVSQTLLKIAKSKKFPQALLFAGPKGTGKTSAARILAKAVNCLKPDLVGEPCNQCPNCQEITQGSSLDILEIDAASNRGIDDIRNLREKIKLAPTKLKYKVYIIDEVHMLTMEAFNALLKTLEEPPAHTIFVLCTTEPEKLPETIISRCLQLKFRKARIYEIVNALKRAVKGEKLRLEEGVLEEIAKAVDGSFRDAHKILEQLSLGGEEITLKQTQKILGIIGEDLPGKLLDLVIKRQTKESIKEIDKAVEAGVDLNFYVLRILERLRSGLLAKVGLEAEATPEELKNLSLKQIQFLIRLFSKAAQEMKISPILQLPIEMAVIEYCSQNYSSRESPKIIKKEPIKENFDSGNGEGKELLKKIENSWQEILNQIKPLNHSVEALLRASRPIEVADNFLTLEVFYKFHKERLEAEKCRVIVEEVVSQFLGEPIKLRCVLGEKKPRLSNNESDIIEIANALFNQDNNDV